MHYRLDKGGVGVVALVRHIFGVKNLWVVVRMQGRQVQRVNKLQLTPSQLYFVKDSPMTSSYVTLSDMNKVTATHEDYKTLPPSYFLASHVCTDTNQKNYSDTGGMVRNATTEECGT